MHFLPRCIPKTRCGGSQTPVLGHQCLFSLSVCPLLYFDVTDAFPLGLDLDSDKKQPAQFAEGTSHKGYHFAEDEYVESLPASAPKRFDSTSITSRNELQKDGMMSFSSTPIQGTLYTSPRTKAEPVAMRSSFAVGVSVFIGITTTTIKTFSQTENSPRESRTLNMGIQFSLVR